MTKVEIGNSPFRVLVGVIACFIVVAIIGCGSGGTESEKASSSQPVVQDLHIDPSDTAD